MTRFGDVTVDEPARELRLDGELQHLEPQAFDVLSFLLANRDRVVAKSEILDEVWGDQFVSESALTTRIKEIRRAVGDDGRTQAVIKNVRGRGYRFVAEIRDTPRSGAEDAAVGTRRPLPARRALVGRGVPSVTAVEAAESSRVVTLLGPGGVGKTSLAIDIAHQLAPARADGAFFVDLTPITDSDDVLASMRQAAGYVQVSAEQQTIESLRALDALLVIDNCEHVLDAVSSLVRVLVDETTQLSVLATSRERLGVPEERVFVVEPLSPSDARALFLGRARSAQPGFEVGARQEPILEKLLESLDYLPLAIEMAAGRLSAFGLDELADLLEGRLDILQSGERGVVERHSTLANLISWSEGLLDPDERALFNELSVFAGPVGIDDIVGVLSSTGSDRLDIIGRLASLVDRSLVSADLADRPARYKLLETTRSHLRSTRATSRHLEHAQWFLDVADSADRDLRGPRESTGDDTFARLVPELRTAHTWAREHHQAVAAQLTGALSHYAHSRLFGEPAKWARELLPALDSDPELLGPVAAELAADAAQRADYRSVDKFAEVALKASSPRVQAVALNSIGTVSIYSGDFARVFDCAQQLEDLGDATGDFAMRVGAMTARSLATTHSGDPAGGQACIEPMAQERDIASTDRGWLRYAIAEATAVENAADAIPVYEQAILLGEPANGRLLMSISRLALALNLARHGEPDAALARFRSLLPDLRRDGNPIHLATALSNLTELFVRLEMNEAAMTLLGHLSDDRLTRVTTWYGIEQNQLATTRSIVESRIGYQATEQLISTGRAHGLSAAFRYSIAALD